MERKKLFIIGLALIVLAGITVIVWVLLSNNQSAKETKEITGVQDTTAGSNNDSSDTSTGQTTPEPQVQERSAAELNEAIITQVPSLVVNGQPNFDVTNVKRVDEQWYVVKILNTADKSIGSAWVVFKDEGSAGEGLILVVGPGTSFPPSTPIPASVRKAIK